MYVFIPPEAPSLSWGHLINCVCAGLPIHREVQLDIPLFNGTPFPTGPGEVSAHSYVRDTVGLQQESDVADDPLLHILWHHVQNVDASDGVKPDIHTVEEHVAGAFMASAGTQPSRFPIGIVAGHAVPDPAATTVIETVATSQQSLLLEPPKW